MVPQVAVLKSEGEALEEAMGEAGVVGKAQKVVAFHVAENGEALVREAFESGAVEAGGDIAQIAINAYQAATDFSVVEQVGEEIHSTATVYRYHTPQDHNTQSTSTTPHKTITRSLQVPHPIRL